jgi:hypothetical protein
MGWSDDVDMWVCITGAQTFGSERRQTLWNIFECPDETSLAICVLDSCDHHNDNHTGKEGAEKKWSWGTWCGGWWVCGVWGVLKDQHWVLTTAGVCMTA